MEASLNQGVQIRVSYGRVGGGEMVVTDNKCYHTSCRLWQQFAGGAADN